nr:MFS transporter [Corynebacterium lactis]
MLDVLGNETFRKLFGAQVIALIGTGLLTVALGLLAYDIAGDQAGSVLGTALTVKMVAYVALSPAIAAAAAHISRKPLLIGADLVRMAVAACLPFVTEAWHIYALIFVLQTASATFTPAFQALIPSVLPRESDYTKALSLSRLAYDLESVVSPMLAAALLTVMSFRNLFLGTVIGFVASATLVFLALPRTRSIGVPTRTSAAEAETSFVERLTSGARAMFRDQALRGLQGINLAVAAAQAMVIVNTVVLVRAYLGRSQSDVAILLGAFGAGSMLVALVMPRLSRRISDTRLMLVGAAAAMALLAVLSLSLPLLGSAPLADAPSNHPLTWAAFLALWLFLGASVSLMLTPSSKLIASVGSESQRPALFAAQFSLSHACFLITFPLAGVAGSSLGLPATSAALAGVGTLGVALATWNWRPHLSRWLPRGIPHSMEFSRIVEEVAPKTGLLPPKSWKN